MSEMVERVARALYEQEDDSSPLYEGAAHFYRWDGPNFKGQDYFRRIARIAIEAMREPTDEQRNAYYALSRRTETMFDAHWERAIDAALGKVDA